MKRISLILFIFANVNISLFAQKSYGIKIAVNNTNATNQTSLSKHKSLSRLQFGVYGTYSIKSNWFFSGEVIYNQKGNIYDDTYSIADAGKIVNIKLNYLEACVAAGYSFKLKNNQKIKLAIGPYLGYGINGTEKGFAQSIAGPIKVDKKIDFVNSQSKEGTNLKIKPVDVGLNFNLGYMYKKYGVFMSYGLGLANRENFGKALNRVFSIGLNYNLK
jgi:hypothetical protein